MVYKRSYGIAMKYKLFILLALVTMVPDIADGQDTEIWKDKRAQQDLRYGYYAEVTGANGITLKRAGTMFCTPNDWQGWTEPLMSFIYDLHLKNLEPGPNHTPVIMDGEYLNRAYLLIEKYLDRL